MRRFHFLWKYFSPQNIYDDSKAVELFGINSSELINESIFNLINLSDGKFSYGDIMQMSTEKRLFFLRLIIEEKERELEEFKKIKQRK